MTETSSDAQRGMSIEALRKRVAAVEGRFTRIDDQNQDYRRRLDDLMGALESDQRRHREEITVLEEKIESLASENIQLRVILDELLTAAEAFGEGRLDETLADLDARVRQQNGSNDMFGDAAARIGEARAAAGAEGGPETRKTKKTVEQAELRKAVEDEAALTADPEPEIATDGADSVAAEDVAEPLTLTPAKETEPGLEPDAEGEGDGVDDGPAAVEPDEILLRSELEDEASGAEKDAAAAPDEAKDEVLELKTEVLDAKAEEVRQQAQEEAKPAGAEPAGRPGVAEEEKMEAEITTDKETDQLDRILASIRRITSSL